MKSYEGPLANSPNKEEYDENDKLIQKPKKAKVPISFERKKFGGVRMCQRCLRTKVTLILRLKPHYSLIDAITVHNVTNVY